jgi:hypothetical protein
VLECDSLLWLCLGKERLKTNHVARKVPSKDTLRYEGEDLTATGGNFVEAESGLTERKSHELNRFASTSRTSTATPL